MSFFYVNDKKYAIPDELDSEFLAENPNAEEAWGFIIGDKKYAIPDSLAEDFIKENPESKLVSKPKHLLGDKAEEVDKELKIEIPKESIIPSSTYVKTPSIKLDSIKQQPEEPYDFDKYEKGLKIINNLQDRIDDLSPKLQKKYNEIIDYLKSYKTEHSKEVSNKLINQQSDLQLPEGSSFTPFGQAPITSEQSKQFDKIISKYKIEGADKRTTGNKIADSLLSGIIGLGAGAGKSLVLTADNIYNTFAIPQNAVASLFNIESLKTSGKQVREQTKEINPLQFINEKSKELYRLSQEYQPKLKKDFFDYVKDKNYKKAGERFFYDFVNNFPQLATTFLLGYTSGGSAMPIITLGLISGGQQKMQLEEEGKLSEAQQNANAMITGALEYFTEEHLGAGRILRRLLKEKAGKELFKKGLLSAIKNIGKNVLFAGHEEGSEEVVNAIGNDITDMLTGRKDVGNVKSITKIFIQNAPNYLYQGLQGAAGGVVLGGGGAVVNNIYNNLQVAKQEKDMQKAQAVVNSSLSTMLDEINKRIDDGDIKSAKELQELLLKFVEDDVPPNIDLSELGEYQKETFARLNEAEKNLSDIEKIQLKKKLKDVEPAKEIPVEQPKAKEVTPEMTTESEGLEIAEELKSPEERASENIPSENKLQPVVDDIRNNLAELETALNDGDMQKATEINNKLLQIEKDKAKEISEILKTDEGKQLGEEFSKITDAYEERLKSLNKFEKRNLENIEEQQQEQKPEEVATETAVGEKPKVTKPEVSKSAESETTQEQKVEKQPYEMTREEFKKSEVGKKRYEDYLNKLLESQKKNFAYPYDTTVDILHEKFVEQALTEGKTVPSEVLKDYPDLVEKYKQKEIEPVGKFKDEVSQTYEMTESKSEKIASHFNLEKASKFTKNEWIERQKKIYSLVPERVKGQRDIEFAKEHRAIIENALKQGIEVSQKVLKDYPDLAEKYKPTAKEKPSLSLTEKYETNWADKNPKKRGLELIKSLLEVGLSLEQVDRLFNYYLKTDRLPTNLDYILRREIEIPPNISSLIKASEKELIEKKWLNKNWRQTIPLAQKIKDTVFAHYEFDTMKKETPERTPKEQKEISPQAEIKQSNKVYEIPVKDINVDLKKFQGRLEPYSQKTVDSIVKGYNEADMDAIVVWKNPKDNKIYVLKGHSRLEGHKRINKPTIQAKFFNGTEKEAIKFAKESNYKTELQSDVENAIYVRDELSKEYKTKAKLREKLVELFGKNATYLQELSALNPNGKTFTALKEFSKTPDKSEETAIKTIASWVGHIRKVFGDKISNAQEDELFKFLLDPKNRTKIGSKKVLQQRVGVIVNDAFYDKNKALNLQKIRHKESGEVYYDNKHDELKKEIKDLDDEIAKLKDTRALMESEKDREFIDRKIRNLNEGRKALQSELLELEKNKSKIIGRGIYEPSLFDVFDQITEEENKQLKKDVGLTVEEIRDYENNRQDTRNIQETLRKANERQGDKSKSIRSETEYREPIAVRRGQTGNRPTGKESVGGRPAIRIASESLIPEPEDIGNVDSYELDTHQKLGIKLALTNFKKGNKGFMLADGTGVGKTRQLLVIAIEHQKASGKPSLIVTQSKQIIENNFKADAEALGIDLSDIEIATYDEIRTRKKGLKHYGLVLFDEAHNLKNIHSAKTKIANKIKTDKKLFATATPMDRIISATYFLSEITGGSQADIQKKLGYKIVKITENGITREEIRLDENNNWDKVFNNLLKLRDNAIKSGAMIRREYPFYGEIKDVKMDKFSEKQRTEIERINEYWEKEKDKIREKLSRVRGDNEQSERIRRSLRKRLMNIGGQQTGELSRWTEAQKVDFVFNNVIKDVKDGKSIVIIAESIKTTKIKALNKEFRGFIETFTKKLKNAGYDFARVYGTNNKASEVNKFNNNKVKILVATPKSGGIGINLDDTTGNNPRVMYVVTANYSGDMFEQILGRVSRKNTKSPATVKFVYSDSPSDIRRKEIIERKVKVLKAIQVGEDIDKAGMQVEKAEKPKVAEETKPKFELEYKHSLDEVKKNLEDYVYGLNISTEESRNAAKQIRNAKTRDDLQPIIKKYFLPKYDELVTKDKINLDLEFIKSLPNNKGFIFKDKNSGETIYVYDVLDIENWQKKYTPKQTDKSIVKYKTEARRSGKTIDDAIKNWINDVGGSIKFASKLQLNKQYGTWRLVGRKSKVTKPKFRIADTKLSDALTSEMSDTIISIGKQLTGSDKIEIVEKIKDNPKASGRYFDGLIQIVNNKETALGTVTHESVHYLRDMVFDKETNEQLDRDLKEVGWTEEDLSENINAYIKNNGYKIDGGKFKQSFPAKIRKYIRKIINFIKKLLGSETAIDRINNLYDKILRGEFAKGEKGVSSGEELFRELGGEKKGLTQKQRGLLFGMAKNLGIDKDNLHKLIKRVVDKESAKDLTNNDLNKIIKEFNKIAYDKGSEEAIKESPETFDFYDKIPPKKQETYEPFSKVSGRGKPKPKIGESSKVADEGFKEDYERLEKFFEKRKTRKDWEGTLKLGFGVRHYFDFVDMAGVTSEVTGDPEVYSTAIEVAMKLTEYKRELDDIVKEIVTSYKDTWRNATPEELKSVTLYLTTGKIDENLHNNKDLKQLALETRKILQFTKPFVRVKRMIQYFDGKLKDEDFHENTLKYLKKWKKEYGSDYKKKTERWKDFVKRVKEGKEEGSELLVRNYYLPEDTKYMKLHWFDENIFESSDDYLGLSKKYIKKMKQGIGDEDPILKAFRVVSKTLRMEYLEEPLNRMRKLLKKYYQKAYYDKYLLIQLRDIAGLRAGYTQTEKAIKRAMGNMFGVLLIKGNLIPKQYMQRLLGAEKVVDIKDYNLIKGSNYKQRIIKEYGEELWNRFEHDMSQKSGIYSMAAKEFVGTVKARIRDITWDALKTHQVELGAIAIDKLFNNFAVEVFAQNLAKYPIELYQHLDIQNRASVFYNTLKLVKEANKTSKNWEQFKRKINYNLMDRSERYFLAKVYQNQGLEEFAYWYGKMKSLKKNFEYTRELRNVYASSPNIAVAMVYQYSPWYRGYQKNIYKMIRNGIINKDPLAVLDAMTSLMLTAMFVKMVINVITGTLPNKDDDNFLERLKKSALGAFDPTDWTGSWGMNTMISPISPFTIEQIKAGEPVYPSAISENVPGQFANIAIQLGTIVVNMLVYKNAKNFKEREEVLKAIANSAHQYGRSTYYLYNVAERSLSLLQKPEGAEKRGTKRANVTAEIFKQLGMIDYEPTPMDRNLAEKISFFLFGKNPKTQRKELTFEEAEKKLIRDYRRDIKGAKTRHDRIKIYKGYEKILRDFNKEYNKRWTLRTLRNKAEYE